MGTLRCDFCGRSREEDQIRRFSGGFLSCVDQPDCRQYSKEGEFTELGQKIIDMIISAKLISPQCATDADHGVVSVWSANADEQIGMLIKSTLRRRL
jgi:hypothetical protein